MHSIQINPFNVFRNIDPENIKVYSLAATVYVATTVLMTIAVYYSATVSLSFAIIYSVISTLFITSALLVFLGIFGSRPIRRDLIDAETTEFIHLTFLDRNLSQPELENFQRLYELSKPTSPIPPLIHTQNLTAAHHDDIISATPLYLVLHQRVIRNTNLIEYLLKNNFPYAYRKRREITFFPISGCKKLGILFLRDYLKSSSHVTPESTYMILMHAPQKKDLVRFVAVVARATDDKIREHALPLRMRNRAIEAVKYYSKKESEKTFSYVKEALETTFVDGITKIISDYGSNGFFLKP